MEKIHIERNTVQETLVIPLFARKLCTEVFGDFFQDPKAVELMNRLDYDFSGSEKKSRNAIVRFAALEVAVRQKACQEEVRQYLKTHPKASVVCLGCGLDQTAETCDNGSCKIYNVDFPDIIAIRSQLIPPGERVTNLSADLNDPGWYSSVDRENGAVFFATGVFYYFSQEQIRKLFNGMAAWFHDGILVFDVTGKLAAKVGVKNFIRQSGIEGVFAPFYVNDVDREINSWLKNGRASAKPYMTGYFSLREKSISGFARFLAKFADSVMKMKIVRVQFDPAG